MNVWMFPLKKVVLSVMLRLILTLCLFGSLSLFGQKDRFLKEVFDSVRISTIQYSDVYKDLAHQADVYQPAGDTASLRPLVLYVHGGSFISGDKGSNDCRDFCMRFARLGYVAVSVNYRLATLLQFMVSKDVQMQIVMKSMADIKSAIRYFGVDAATANQYRCDTNRVFLGGYSAGAVAALHTAYIDSLSELTAAEQQLLKSAVGNLDGDAGNNSGSFRLKALFSLAGALHKPAWISSGEEPVWLAHSRDDATVSFNCAPGLGLPNVLELCGTGKLLPALRNKNVMYDSMLLDKEGHGWPSGGNGNASFVKALTEISKFLYPMVQTATLGVADMATKSSMLYIFPNPAGPGASIRLNAEQPLGFVRMFNVEGKLMLERRFNGQERALELDVAHLPAGFYWVETAAGRAKLALER